MLFDNTMKWVDSFVLMDSEVAEGSGKKAESRGKDKAEGSKERTRKELNKESVKRQKLKDDAKKAQLKLCIEIVLKDDEAINIESLAIKYPIVNWKTHILDEDKMYYQIISANGSTKYYKIFSAMLDDFDRQDVLDLYRLVKKRFETTSPEGYDRFLWGDLITLFEPSEEDEIWKTQQDYTLISWRLYDSCGVHLLLMDTRITIHMLSNISTASTFVTTARRVSAVRLIIRVKQKQLNLGVGTERIIFNIDYVMKHSYSNDDTFFSIDVIDEILEEDFDALLDEGSKILHSIEGTYLEEEIFVEFDEFMAMTADENSNSESDT
ncbi:hypothetical protein Tco_0889855 [Tanacetum coccineum]